MESNSEIDLSPFLETSERRLRAVKTGFERYLTRRIRWNSRLVGIRGARGTGKTTLLLQQMKREGENNGPGRSLYLSLDNIRFQSVALEEVVRQFAARGGNRLFLDEVHRHPDWSLVVKNIYDDYPDLSIRFTGSSLLSLRDGTADLSRRAVMFDLHGLSFREYLCLKTGIELPVFDLRTIIADHERIAAELVASVRPLARFAPYLEHGFYPFFLEGEEDYGRKLEEILAYVLDVELPQLRGVAVEAIPKLRKLLLAVAESAPFTPNVSKLAERTGLGRNTVVEYLGYLKDAAVLALLYRDAVGVSRLSKPDKIYLDNPNLVSQLGGSSGSVGAMRETFLLGQLRAAGHRVEYPERGDFRVDGNLVVEVGGAGKGSRQIAGSDEGVLAVDNVEIGSGCRIPLWLFGFLY